MSFPLPKKSLRAYLADYQSEHRTLGNRLTHMVGIPLIVASLPAMVVVPPVGGAMFVAGWAFQFVGHYVFEKNKPAFFGDVYYLLVGPLWVAKEFAAMVGLAT